ncbi:MAG: radical SAM protein [Parcubacteria group bacterium]|jgi:MoaA/NifB/PqqE/SkfB family radical SAM enzyme
MIRKNKKKFRSRRFTIRNEYFGGLIYDSLSGEISIIDSGKFNFLEYLCHEGSIDIKSINESNEKNVEDFVKMGLIKKNAYKICISNCRLVKSKSIKSKNCLSAPLRVYDTFTRKCNLNCHHCYARSGNINFSEKKRTINQTRKIIKKFFDAGATEWRITGGEPTVDKYLFETIKYANGLGMVVSLNSNGCWNNEMFKKIINSGIRDLVISLEGSEKINDKRRTKGAYNLVAENLKKLHEYNENSKNKIPVVINVAIGSDNIRETDFLVEVAMEYKCDINFIPLKPSGRAIDNDTNKLILTANQYKKFAKKIQDLRSKKEVINSGIKVLLKHKDLFNYNLKDKSQNPFPFDNSECGALIRDISILPDGRVVACPFLIDYPEFIGPNAIGMSVDEIWHHSMAEHYRNAKKIDCLKCSFYKKECRGKCRSTVILTGGKIKGGKLLGGDPFCFAHLMREKIH